MFGGAWVQLEGEKAEAEKRAVSLSNKLEDQARKLAAKDAELANLRTESAANASRAKQAERSAATATAEAESARAATRQATDTGRAQVAAAQKKAHAEAAEKVRDTIARSFSHACVPCHCAAWCSSLAVGEIVGHAAVR